MMLKFAKINFIEDFQSPIINYLNKYSTNPYFEHSKIVNYFKSFFEKKVLNNWLEPLLINDAILIENIPVGNNLPKTPTDEKYNFFYKPCYTSEISILYLSSMIGVLKKYDSEKNGDYIHNNYPLPHKALTQSNSGYDIELEFHNEIAFDVDRPDYVILLCLRADEKKQAKTRISSIQKFLATLTNEEIEILCQPIFKILSPESFDLRVEKLMPMIQFNNGNLIGSAFNFNKNIVTVYNQDAQNILDKAYDFFHSHKLNVKLEAGSALIINNITTVHARSRYNINEVNSRWLQRIYIKSIV